MKRDYATGTKYDAVFFVGVEIEHTPCINYWTLFVVGLQPVNEIIQNAKKNNCDHIYIGANHSFTGEHLMAWSYMISDLLDAGFWITFDFDVKHYDQIQNTGILSQNKLIPMISVKLPNIQNLNYNAILKIDDKDFKASNPGVWCHKVHNLKDPNVFTHWEEYKNDKILDCLPDPATSDLS